MKLRQDLTQGGRYIEELFAGDVLVIGAPMIRAEGVNISPRGSAERHRKCAPRDRRTLYAQARCLSSQAIRVTRLRCFGRSSTVGACHEL